jgi:hypothetical protein
VDQFFSIKALETGEETFQNVFFNTYLEESKMKTKNETNSPVQEGNLLKTVGSQVKLDSLANPTPPAYENSSNHNTIINNNFYNLGLYYLNSDGLKVPLVSRKYIVKQYNKADFPDEE